MVQFPGILWRLKSI